MKAVYRTVSAVLAIAAGLVLAALITAVVQGRDVEPIGVVLYGIAALIAAGVAVVLWAKAIDRR